MGKRIRRTVKKMHFEQPQNRKKRWQMACDKHDNLVRSRAIFFGKNRARQSIIYKAICVQTKVVQILEKAFKFYDVELFFHNLDQTNNIRKKI